MLGLRITADSAANMFRRSSSAYGDGPQQNDMTYQPIHALGNAFQVMESVLARMQETTMEIDKKTERTDRTLRSVAEGMELQNRRLERVERRLEMVEGKLHSFELTTGADLEEDNNVVNSSKGRGPMLDTAVQTRFNSETNLRSSPSEVQIKIQFEGVEAATGPVTMEESTQVTLKDNSPHVPPATRPRSKGAKRATGAKRNMRSVTATSLPFSFVELPRAASSVYAMPAPSKPQPAQHSPPTPTARPRGPRRSAGAQRPAAQPSPPTTIPATNRAGVRDALGRRLLKAAQDGALPAIKKLLKQGADVNYKNTWRWTSLHWASMRAHADVVSLLLKSGADAAAKTSSGNTALHMAAHNDRSGRIALMLTDCGCEVDVWNQFGRTPLHLGAESGNEPAVRALLAAGASKIAEDDSGRIPFEVAKSSCVRELLAPCSSRKILRL